jgi:triosephosphate isomerase
MPTILLAANWKMNTDLATAGEITRRVISASDEHANLDWLICPPYVYLQYINDLLQTSKLFLGVQDVSEYQSGAHTSQISASMAQNVGATHAIVGHSECRHGLGQSNQAVALKFKQAQSCDITPVLCVGETLMEREAGNAEAVVFAQLDAVLFSIATVELPELIVAYEPVWAIGTGVNANASDVAEMHAAIRKHIGKLCPSLLVNTRILYGGSVKAANAEELIMVEGVDGFLIGGASLTEEFIQIGEICSKYCS